jgi:prepilin-type N-terminal cleavage/methylation domain-containing protein
MLLKKMSAKRNSERGFSIMELMVSLTVFLVAVAAVYGVARLATIQRNTVNTRTDQLRSARIAIEYIRRDALNAGFGYHRTGGLVPDNIGNTLFSLPSDTDAVRDFLTAIVAGNERNTNSLNFGGKTDVVGFISRDITFNRDPNDQTTWTREPKVSYTGTTPVGTVINLTTAATEARYCKQYDLYLLESGSGVTQMVAMATSIPNTSTIQLAPGDPLSINQSASGVGEAQSLLAGASSAGTIKKINLVSYSVTPAGVLVRKQYGNRLGLTAAEQIETREMVYGVSDFQIKYFLEDGTTVDDPSNGNEGRNNQMLMNNVVQIQVSITIANDPNDSQPRAGSPITIREFISTKNLRYEAS